MIPLPSRGDPIGFPEKYFRVIVMKIKSLGLSVQLLFDISSISFLYDMVTQFPAICFKMLFFRCVRAPLFVSVNANFHMIIYILT